MTRAGSVALLVASSLLAGPAHAELKNFDVAGKVFVKGLYKNDDSQGCLTLGNPFWPESFSGSNGVCGEVELTLEGRVSKTVSAWVRLKSRYGATWQDYFETGNERYGEPNTSGDSLGLDHAEFFKLRGYYVRLKPPVEAIRYVRIGSSDLSQFDPWTVGKIRYIDRDNTKGVFVDSHFGEDTKVGLHLAAIALPKLWVGPSWSTGLGDPALSSPLWTQDWAYAARLGVEPDADWKLTVVASVTNDLEVNVLDPDARSTRVPSCRDALGKEVPGCEQDHAVDLSARYRNAVATALLEGDLSETMSGSAFVGWSASQIDESLAANGVADNAGVYPLAYKDTGADVPDDLAWRLRARWDDPFDAGVSLSTEYFYVGQDWVSMFGARRESDVLLTDGVIGEDQLPTLNLANEFMDFDEPWAESIIGWHGGTGIVAWEAGSVTTGLEITGITYNTNAQGRDVDAVYPTFQHSEGYTDTDLFDYANITDRGRDPRSVYRKDQDRLTLLGVARVDWAWSTGWKLHAKVKGIRDTDGRDTGREDDDYDGLILQGRLSLKAPFATWLSGTLGVGFDRWDEKARSGSENLGYRDYLTDKGKGWIKLAYDHGGARATWVLEALAKDQQRAGKEDQAWAVVRSKATLEVAW